MPEFKIEIPLLPVMSDVNYFFERVIEENQRLVADPEMQSRRANSCFFLRNEKNEICGGAVAEFRYDLVYVEAIWVAPEFRRQGHAARLYRALEDLAYIKNKRRAILSTFQFQDAIEFWKKQGFLKVGEIPGVQASDSLTYMYKMISSEDR